MSDDAAKRTGDGKLIAITVAVVLGIGLAIMGGIWGLLQVGDNSKPCSGWQTAGEYQKIRDNSQDTVSSYDFGNGCEAAVVAHDGELVAVRPRLQDCSEALQWSKPDQSFTCNKSVVPWDALTMWPTRLQKDGSITSLQIDFGNR